MFKFDTRLDSMQNRIVNPRIASCALSRRLYIHGMALQPNTRDINLVLCMTNEFNLFKAEISLTFVIVCIVFLLVSSVSRQQETNYFDADVDCGFSSEV